jgi:hypothetical protein
MKEVIEKAIKNGFEMPMYDKRTKYLKCYTYKYGVSITTTKNAHGGWIGYHELIFGTDFIDRLVGKGGLSKICCNCSHAQFVNHTNNLIKCEFHSLQKAGNTCGNFEPIIKSADYHLQKMSTIRDIEKLKEYVRGLI